MRFGFTVASCCCHSFVLSNAAKIARNWEEAKKKTLRQARKTFAFQFSAYLQIAQLKFLLSSSPTHIFTSLVRHFMTRSFYYFKTLLIVATRKPSTLLTDSITTDFPTDFSFRLIIRKILIRQNNQHNESRDSRAMISKVQQSWDQGKVCFWRAVKVAIGIPSVGAFLLIHSEVN